MRILLAGASGFIGSHLAEALTRAGHQVIACVRNPSLAEQRWPGITAMKVDFSQDMEIKDWVPRLKDVDIVINAVGIIRESGSQSFDALHTRAPIALFRACERAKVKQVIQISALGSDETAFSQYHLSKRAADQCLMALDLKWVILMPSIVYGPGAKSMAFFKAMAALPWVPLVAAGDQPIQPIHIADLTRAVLQIIATGGPNRRRIPLVGPQPITMKNMYAVLRRWLGWGEARFVSVPYGMALLAGRLGGFLGNTPLTRDAIEMLRRGNTGDVTIFMANFGFAPRGFDAAFAHTPAQQSDRWYARLYFLSPLLRYAIGLLWVFTGIISACVFPVEQSYAMLSQAGIAGPWAPFMLYSAAAADLILGLATLAGYRIAVIGLIQIAVIVLYSVIISFSQPEQWIHPFGPVSKNLPLIVSTLIMIVLARR